MSDKLDLSKLKKDIDSLKKERSSKDQHLGIQQDAPKPKNHFLKNLVEAYNTNSQNEATETIKKVAVKSNDYSKVKDPLLEHVGNTPKPKPKPTTQTNSQGGMFEGVSSRQNNSLSNTNELSPERDDELFKEIERRTQEYNNRAGKDLNLAPEEYMNKYYNQSSPKQINNQQEFNDSNFEQNVINIFEKYFGNRLNDIIKEVVTEVFYTEKMNVGINNNREAIQDIVKDTIRLLKKKK